LQLSISENVQIKSMLLSSGSRKSKIENDTEIMNENKKEIAKKVAKVGGWQVAKRVAKRIPVIGTVLTIGLVGHDIRKKGLIKGVVNSGLDAVPFVGTAKGVIELFTGDLLSDKQPKPSWKERKDELDKK
jgi:hypothetical protein